MPFATAIRPASLLSGAAAVCLASSASSQIPADRSALAQQGFTEADLKAFEVTQVAPSYAYYRDWEKCAESVAGLFLQQGRSADEAQGVFQPIQRADYGSFKHAFREQFNFDAKLARTSPKTGFLTFRGGVRGREYISYAVRPYGQAVAILSVKVRLQGKSEDLRGTEMCWRTYSILTFRP